MKNVSNSIKQVMVVFLFCFVALISYIAYFQVFSAPTIAESEGNQRLWARRNEVLREPYMIEIKIRLQQVQG